jgi:hypothetical protein
MKATKIITHPYLLIAIFLLIIVSGEHWGGFYLLYLLLALPHGGAHAICAVLGIAILLFSYHKYHRSRIYIIENLLNIIGALLLLLSLFLFFYNDKRGYNSGTFSQAVPLIVLGLFSLVALCFLADNIFHFSTKNSKGDLFFRG